MLFGRSRTGNAPAISVPLKPFAFRLGDSYVVGVAADPSQGSPCSGCVERWLRRRDLTPEPVAHSSLPPVARDSIADALLEGTPHLAFEIGRDGIVTRLDSLLFPHPECECRKDRFLGPSSPWGKRTNFVFSPITRLEAARYGTPDGNVWLARATGDLADGKSLSVTAGGRDRETARFAAVDRWLLASAQRAETCDAKRVTHFPSGEAAVAAPPAPSYIDGMGAGASEEDALNEALVDRTRRLVLRQYAASTKPPMLVVGTQNWLRLRVPFFLLQRYDVHLLFYPNAHPAWVVGVVALCRKGLSGEPIFSFAAGSKIGEAIDKALFGLVDKARPNDPFVVGSEEAAPPSVLDDGGTPEESTVRKAVRSLHWWNHWVYRCPKLSLQDMLHLEDYKGIERWRQFYQDGMPKLCVDPQNSALCPAPMRRLVRVAGIDERLNPLVAVGGVGSFRAMEIGEGTYRE